MTKYVVLDKSVRVKQFTRTRKGKIERVKEYQRAGAPLAPKGTIPGSWSLVNGEWRIAKVGFLGTTSDYETAIRWYLPKTSSELREARRRNSKSYVEKQIPVKVEDGMSSDFVSKVSELIHTMKNARPEWKYVSTEDFIHQNGKKFDYVMPGVKKGKMGQCYKNAYHLMDITPGLTYVEGYAVSGDLPLPLMHAWCVDKNGVVYDSTWDNGKSYLGVQFKREFVTKTILRRKVYGVMDDMDGGWPLLRGVPEEEWKV